MKTAFQNVRIKKNEVEAPAPVVETKVEVTREPKRDKLGRSYATGRRKESTARVWISPAKGKPKITVCGKPASEYFARPVLQMIINQPLAATKTEGQFDIMCTASGGGLSGQAGAVRHGIAQALRNYDPQAYQVILRKGGFLTRDPRAVERKKAGLKKARKRPQFSKR